MTDWLSFVKVWSPRVQMVIKPAMLQRVQRLIEVSAILSKTTTTSYHMADCLGPAGHLIIRYEDIYFAIIVLINSSFNLFRSSTM